MKGATCPLENLGGLHSKSHVIAGSEVTMGSGFWVPHPDFAPRVTGIGLSLWVSHKLLVGQTALL